MTALQEAAMRKALEALETCSYGDYSAKHVVDPSFDGDAVEAAIESLKDALAQQGYKPSCLHGDDDYCKACYMQETTAALQESIPVQPNIKNQIFTDISSPRPKGIEDALFRPSVN